MDLLVDSTVWIDYFNGTVTPQTDLLDRLLGRSTLVLGDLVVAEVLQGFRRERDFRTARTSLLAFEVRHIGGRNLALQSAENYRRLRRLGVTVRKTIDCLIATYCIETTTLLLHADRDFDPFERHLGLHVLHP